MSGYTSPARAGAAKQTHRPSDLERRRFCDVALRAAERAAAARGMDQAWVPLISQLPPGLGDDPTSIDLVLRRSRTGVYLIVTCIATPDRREQWCLVRDPSDTAAGGQRLVADLIWHARDRRETRRRPGRYVPGAGFHPLSVPVHTRAVCMSGPGNSSGRGGPHDAAREALAGTRWLAATFGRLRSALPRRKVLVAAIFTTATLWTGDLEWREGRPTGRLAGLTKAPWACWHLPAGRAGVQDPPQGGTDSADPTASGRTLLIVSAPYMEEFLRTFDLEDVGFRTIAPD